MAKIVVKPVESALKTLVIMWTELALQDAQLALWQNSVTSVCCQIYLLHFHSFDILKKNLFLTWTYIYKNDYISLAGYSLKITMCSLEDCIHKWQSIGFKGCQDGQYGRDCRYNCSGNCLNDGVCDRQNGTCGSCAMGYQGRKCDKSMA